MVSIPNEEDKLEELFGIISDLDKSVERVGQKVGKILLTTVTSKVANKASLKVSHVNLNIHYNITPANFL